MSDCHIINQISIDQSIFSPVISATKSCKNLIRSEIYLFYWQSYIWEKRTSGKTMLCCGDILSVRNNQLLHFLQVTSQDLWKKYSFGTKLPDNDVDCLKKNFIKFFHVSNVKWKKPPLSENILRLKLNIYSKFWNFKIRVSYNYRHTLFSNTRTTNLLSPVKFC